MTERRKVVWAFLVMVAVVVTILTFRPFAHRDGKGYELARCGMQMRVVLNAIRSYQSEMLAYPTGSGSKVIRQLQGSNPKQRNFIETSSIAFNSLREWVDPWGTPFTLVVDPNGGGRISSAGPNRQFGDADDLEVLLEDPATERR
jgi:type II secretory pathway pseudopilin PulG